MTVASVAAIPGPFRGTVGAGMAGCAVDELEQLSDETGGLELVEQLDPGAETVEGELFDGVPFEFMLGDQLQDEFLLLVGAGPAAGGEVGAGGVLQAETDIVLESVFVSGDKADLLDFAIDGVLKKTVEPRGFALHLAEVRQFCLDRDTELVGAVAGETESFWRSWR